MKKVCCAERIACALAVLPVIFSCGDPVYMGTPYLNVNGGGTESPDVTETKSLYVTGIEYPPDYNWLPEVGGGSIEANMFLMKDGRRIVEIMVGEKYHVSSDIDMHRQIGEHLYTDYSTDEETIIKKDGIEIFRYPDREMIYSMLVDGDDVYTLGSPRSGSGFTCRCNGRVLVSKGSANIKSALYNDDGHIVFAYEDVIVSAKDTRYKYYYVVDGEVRSLDVANDVVRVDDIRIIHGDVHYIASYSDKSYRIYYSGNDASFELRMPKRSVIPESELVYNGGEVFVKGGSQFETAFWHSADIQSYSSNMMTLDWCADKENVYYLITNQSSRTSLVLKHDKTGITLPPQFWSIFSGCMAADEGRRCIAAADRSSMNSPVLWIDGEVSKYDFNGFFTSVSYH